MEQNSNSSHPYDALTPEVILEAVETFGTRCTGAFLALNSYENRVYRVDREDMAPVVAKFYRPQRWSNEQILEEHSFSQELTDQEIPVIAPLAHEGATLHTYKEFRFSLFPWQPGRAPELTGSQDREIIGRYLGRLHNVGAATPFQYRPTLDLNSFGRESVQYILENNFLPGYLEEPYSSLTQHLLDHISRDFDAFGMQVHIRLHGDCHLSNLLWTDTGPHIVDLDDCRMGPAVQDLWMLLSGNRDEAEPQLEALLQGYTQFARFNANELRLIEPLRTLRMLYYSAWLARRWGDPAFPRNFPWFNTERYWEEQILALREQLALLDEPPLAWMGY
ncbi:MAG: serine/threonine protein kinase [Gammaproteobacteria bacterium]|nr:serine/threonine protein kinase [Gammaproteobacteria bacterium]